MIILSIAAFLAVSLAAVQEGDANRYEQHAPRFKFKTTRQTPPLISRFPKWLRWN